MRQKEKSVFLLEYFHPNFGFHLLYLAGTKKRCARKPPKKVLLYKNCDLFERDKLGWKSILRCFLVKNFLNGQASPRYRSSFSTPDRKHHFYFLNSIKSIWPHAESTNTHIISNNISANIYYVEEWSTIV